MAFCTNCGAQIPDSSKFCGYCGQALNVPKPETPNAPVYTPSPKPSNSSYSSSYSGSSPSYSNSGSSYSSTPSVPHYNTTGLMIWSIISLLFGALIFGILALSNTTQINKCDTVEEQEKKIKAARRWCIVSTIIGILVIIGRSAQGG